MVSVRPAAFDMLVRMEDIAHEFRPDRQNRVDHLGACVHAFVVVHQKSVLESEDKRGKE